MQKPRSLAWLSQETHSFISAETEYRAPMETGGSLIGYWATSPNEVVITHATGPGPAAVHKPYSFLPDDVYQESAIADCYQKSGRLQTYLGDWHSHPDQTSLSLSRTDKLTLRKIANYRHARMPIPIMLVVGKTRENISVWRYEPTFLAKMGIAISIIPMELRITEVEASRPRN